MHHDLSSSTRLLVLIAPLAALLVGCGGGGGSSGDSSPSGPTVVVSGKITFDRIPFQPTPGQGLNPAATVESPARQIVVEAIGSAGNVLVSTTTDSNGNYSLTAPSQTNVFVR